MQANMVECEICFTELKESEVELHRAKCIPRLVFRCTLCNEDYMNKEGLWNHMDLHEIADESKELHYQEIKAKHMLRQCSMCNDQRAYSESLYWNHIQDAHDGFFLRCSKCGEQFQSEKDRDSHEHCNARDPTVASESGDYKAGRKSSAKDTDDVALTMEVKVEETTLAPLDGRGISTSEACWLAEKSTPEGTIQNPPDDDATCNKCSHCGKKMPSAVSLDKHISNNHVPVQCDICGITFSSRCAARYHEATKHKESKFKCPHCSKPFLRERMFKQHVAKCSDRNSTQKQGQNSVETICLTKDSSLPNKASGSQDKPFVNSGLMETKCSYCVKVFPRPVFFYRHRKKYHDRIICDICGEAFHGWRRHNHHKITCQPKPNLGGNVCPICGKKINRSREYRVHVTICERRKHVCEICGRRFKQSYTLSRHKRQDHPNMGALQKVQSIFADSSKQLYWCRICGESTSTYSKARYHKRIKHTEAKYQCPHCLKKIYDVVSFKIHVPTCEARKHPCALCGKKLTSKYSMTEHMKRVHGELHVENCGELPQIENASSGSSWFKCPYCGKKYSKEGYLLRHIKLSHVPWSEPCLCNICGISFTSVIKRDYHMIRKHNEPRYKCPHCPMKFERTDRYRTHLSLCKTRKYSCDICGHKFKRNSTVVRHKQKFHNSCGENGSDEQQQTQNEKVSFAKDISNEAVQTDTMNIPQSGNIELKMEIYAEDTLLQECQVPNDDRQKSITTILSSQLINDDKTKHVEADNATLESDIKVKEKYMEEEKETLAVPQSTSEPTERHQVPSDRNESLERRKAADQFVGSCSICELTFETKLKMDHHMIVSHTKPQYKCSQCPKSFHFADTQRRHEKIHKKIADM